MRIRRGQAAGPALAFEALPAGAGHYAAHGVSLPLDAMEAARAADAILLSAMSLPDVRYPDGTEIAPQIELRMAMGLYAGVWPVFTFEGQPCPLADERAGAIDFVLLRESTEGLFHSHGRGTVTETEARETLLITRATSERLFDFVPGLAAQRRDAGRGPGRVTCVDKANVFGAFAFFRRIFPERAARRPDLAADVAYVDAMALRMVQAPWELDVLATENMFGDILSDFGAGLMGAWASRPRPTSAVTTPCSSPATARRPTSWAAAGPTPPP